jgi:flagellar hook-basal body complex protein FliE
MNNSISPLRILPVEINPPRAQGPSPSSEGSDDFMTTLQRSMDTVETAQGEAQSQVSQLVNGKGADLHSAMIAVEKADLSFQLMMQVRNKIVQAYQQVSNMQF